MWQSNGCLLAATHLLVAATLVSAAPEDSTSTESERRELAMIVAEFRRRAARPEQRLSLIDQAGNLGTPAVDSLLRVVHDELRKPLTEYRHQITRAAAESAAARSVAADTAEVAAIRAKVLALSKEKELTEKQIRDVGDPGLKRLHALLVPRVADVRRQRPQLKQARDRLLPLGKQWEKCATLIMLADDPKNDDPKKSDSTAKDGACAEETDDLLELDLPSFEEYLAREEELAAALAIPIDSAARQILSTNQQLAEKLGMEEARCVLDLNVTRVLLGLAPLRLDTALASAARQHSTDMYEHDFFAHKSPLAGKELPWDRAENFGTTANAENIAFGTIDGSVINAMLWHSPSHHKNLVGDYTRVGAGRYGKHWTELFGR